MTRTKTRCKQCLYYQNKATEHPCNRCAEIQCKSVKNEDMFIPSGEENERA